MVQSACLSAPTQLFIPRKLPERRHHYRWGSLPFRPLPLAITKCVIPPRSCLTYSYTSRLLFVFSRSSTPTTWWTLASFLFSPGPFRTIVPLPNFLRQCSSLSIGVWYTGTRSKDHHSIVVIYSTHAHAYIYDAPIGPVSRGIPFAGI